MIGDRLKEIRSDHGDTQQALAGKLNVSKFTVQSWEQEKSAPSHELLVKICLLYNVSSDFLLGLNDDDPILKQSKRSALSEENEKTLKKFEAFLLHEQGNTNPK